MGIEAEDEALFWIARESTGSLRDAYTLFDQVAAFSEGRIRSQVIRDKLGLVGLDRLNALAEACAANDTAGAFAQIEGILDDGVALEQFVVDLAGYYRSLLLLKNGVTRESLLGYGPDRFSPAVREKLDSERLEQALSLLLDLYRDIRYSVSPRFELETVIAKLSWLDRWVSPLEMRTAIADARSALGRSEGGIANPLAGPGRGSPANPNEAFWSAPGQPASESPGMLPEDFSAPGAFSEAFRRRMGSQANAGSPVQEAAARTQPEPGAQTGEPPREKAPDNAPRDLPALREALVRSLGRDRQILASGITKTLPWEWKDSEEKALVIPAADTLTAEVLRKELPLIRRIAGELWGKPLSFEVVETPEDGEEEPGLPPQAELVRRMFRGTVVKKSAKERHNGYQSL
jgi:DNA polymerase-3 subunit gamma/tau